MWNKMNPIILCKGMRRKGEKMVEKGCVCKRKTNNRERQETMKKSKGRERKTEKKEE